MNIACIDSSAQARINLQKLIEGCFDKCRESSGHLLAHKIYPISFEELLLSTSTDAIILGQELSSEQAVSYIEEINKKLPNAHIIVFLEESSLSLFSLKRFELLASTVLTPSDSPVKILHAIESLSDKKKGAINDSKVIYLTGAKGGVGVTSLCSAFAHAGQSLQKRTLLIDLSAHSNLSTYLQTNRSTSAELASFILDSLEKKVPLSENLVLKMIESSPCGLELLLPPSSKKDIRDIWLRNPSVLDQNLSVIEILKNIYDLIIIDGASAEGILPFSLMSRSDHVLITSTSNPASVHLLSKCLEEISNVPGKHDTQVIINHTSKSQLQIKDIENLLKLKLDLSEIVFHKNAVPYENKAKDWIGTGNSFYTEAKSSAQQFLDELLCSILEGKASKEQKQDAEQLESNKGILENLSFNSLYSNISQIFPASSNKNAPLLPERKLLPQSVISSRSEIKEKENSIPAAKKILRPQEIFNGETLQSLNSESLFKKAKIISSSSESLENSSQETN